ncbi:hypothetical protein BVRB_6g138580 isoform A [Beta vulgaris subsp. vulgaris]|nr:hypothetical protein BVRB_6g138580 isoform A [Beta vulgaris subsp. vulgaris]
MVGSGLLPNEAQGLEEMVLKKFERCDLRMMMINR